MKYDRHQYPMTNNRDHLVGQLTMLHQDEEGIVHPYTTKRRDVLGNTLQISTVSVDVDRNRVSVDHGM